MTDIPTQDDEVSETPGLDEAQGTVEPSDEDIVRDALARFKLAEEAESDIRKLALEDLQFRAGNQWPDNIQQDRERDGRPCLVINRLPQFVQQVTNDQRQNRPSIKIHPVGDGADVETAKIIQGLIRHIEYNSNADVAYDTAFEGSASSGFGYFRITTDFVSPDSFDQEIYIKRIRNQFSVFFDPYSQEPDGSDANWAIVTDEFSPEDYKAKYPGSKLAAVRDWDSIGNRQPDWIRGEACRVAEYFYKEMKDEVIHLLKSGVTVKDNELAQHQMLAQSKGVDASVVKTRKTKVPVVKWCKINGIEILERTEWPTAHIPIIPVYGAELYIDGKRILESVIRHAKDPQRMYNYWASAETEAIALAPRTPFIVAAGQIEGYEEHWKNANRRNHSYLPYKPTTIAGQQAPPPQRQNFEPAVQAITNARMIAGDDMKATTGIYEAGQGQQGNEVSGIAIQRRNTQIQTATFHFVDNLHRSLRHCGRIIVDLIPHIYDTARTARIIAEDGEQKMVRINDPSNQDESGDKALYDVTVGTYSVMVDTGPSFASKRQEAAASMQEMTRANPQLMGIVGDLMVKNMDWPGAQEMADRLKLALPPALQADPKKQIPPQVQAQLQQMNQMIQHLTGELSEATKVIETKKLDLEHKERVELMKLQAQIEMKAAELGSKEDLALLNHQITEIKGRLSMLNTNQPIDAPNDFDPQQADGGNYAGIGHIGGSENLTGGDSPGKPPGENP